MILKIPSMVTCVVVPGTSSLFFFEYLIPTRYRSILDGAKSLATACGSCTDGCGSGKVCGDIESATAKLSLKQSEKTGTDPTFPESLLKKYMASPQPMAYMFETPQGKWFHPATVDQLLEIMETYPNAKIINGNTEIGIEVRFKNLKYPVQINTSDILELKQVKETQQGLELGGAINLSTLQKVLTNYVSKRPEHETRALTAMLDNLRYFAGTQIRNVAALAGNIATASPISDLNPVLMGANAIVNLKSKVGSRSIAMRDFFVGYRKTALKPGEVIYSVGKIAPFLEKTDSLKSGSLHATNRVHQGVQTSKTQG
jgi:xanthine dehydrogenase/oxidase